MNNSKGDKDGTCVTVMTILFMLTSMIKLLMIDDEDEEVVLKIGDTQLVPSTT